MTNNVNFFKLNRMAIYKGKQENEIYREVALGKWTHSKANGKTFDSLGSAAADYNNTKPKKRWKRVCFLVIAVIVIIGVSYGIFLD